MHDMSGELKTGDRLLELVLDDIQYITIVTPVFENFDDSLNSSMTNQCQA
jgi:hypothetical protein